MMRAGAHPAPAAGGTGAPLIEVCGADYEHTLALGGVWHGLQLCYHPMSVDDIFLKMITEHAFPVCEFSLANYIMLQDAGAKWLRALPVFTNRNFRHSALYVRRDSPLTDPAQLQGRTIGAEDYSMTAAVWIRGLLRDRYGIDWREIGWCCDPARRRFPVPDAVNLTSATGDLEQMLIDGTIDALISFGPREKRQLRHLIPSVYDAERAYHAETGIYPISHCVVIREDVLQAHPALPHALFEAYTASKQQAYTRRLGATMVPWGKQHWAEMFERFGGDPLPYGLTADNRRVIEKLIDYLADQQLINGRPNIDTLFLPVADAAGGSRP